MKFRSIILFFTFSTCVFSADGIESFIINVRVEQEQGPKENIAVLGSGLFKYTYTSSRGVIETDSFMLSDNQRRAIEQTCDSIRISDSIKKTVEELSQTYGPDSIIEHISINGIKNEFVMNAFIDDTPLGNTSIKIQKLGDHLRSFFSLHRAVKDFAENSKTPRQQSK